MITWTYGDTAPSGLEIGADLTGATGVVLHVHPTPERATLVATAAVTITDAATGQGEFTPPATVQPGNYYADVRYTTATGKTKTTALSTLRVEPHA